MSVLQIRKGPLLGKMQV